MHVTMRHTARLTGGPAVMRAYAREFYADIERFLAVAFDQPQALAP
jgi:hypothetical protein